MNSSAKVWAALQDAVVESGLKIRQADIFDKHHGTFKQFVSDNTAGYDLVLHCFKPSVKRTKVTRVRAEPEKESIFAFLREIDLGKHTNVYLHVARKQEIDMRKLYSEWTARSVIKGDNSMDFSRFRSIVQEWLGHRPSRG